VAQKVGPLYLVYKKAVTDLYVSTLTVNKGGQFLWLPVNRNSFKTREMKSVCTVLGHPVENSFSDYWLTEIV